MCEDIKDLFWKYVPCRQKILMLPYLDKSFQHVPKIKRNPKKILLYLIAKFQPACLAPKFEKKHNIAGQA
jgi:hypothetical protein